MKMFNALVLSVALTSMLTLPANADLIINGSFETPYVSPGISSGPVGGWDIFYNPILGWTPDPVNGLEIQNHVIGSDGTAWSAYDGNQFAELDVYTNSSMYQTVNTIMGKEYTLSFAYSLRPALVLDSSGVKIFINDVLMDTLSADGVGYWNTVWSIHNYSYTATGTSATIKFMATGTSDGMGGFIDGVQFSTACDGHDDDNDQGEDEQNHLVPEPSTMLLLGSGLVGLIGYAKRRLK